MGAWLQQVPLLLKTSTHSVLTKILTCKYSLVLWLLLRMLGKHFFFRYIFIYNVDVLKLLH